jgi:hypothetical protein
MSYDSEAYLVGRHAKIAATKLAKRIKKTCQMCGKEWMEKPSHAWRRFCSRACAGNNLRKSPVGNCIVCGKEFLQARSGDGVRYRNTCSGTCFSEHLSQRNKEKGIQPAHDDRWRASIQSESYRENCSLRLAGRPGTGRNAKNNPDFTNARHLLLRDPRGREHEARNIAKFVRENSGLFQPEDVVWRVRAKKKGRGKTWSCKAHEGLLSLVKPSVTRGSWKGWTVVSIYERRFNDGNDLLDRRDGPEKSWK